MRLPILTINGGGWRNRRTHPFKCDGDTHPSDTPNNDLGFRTFRNARECVVHERKGET